MKRICFVCHGNICRSPMAEAVFKDMIVREGLTDCFEADSAAVSSEELGSPVYPPAAREMARRGLPRSNHRAWQLRVSDYDKYDMFICMDRSNLRWMNSIFGGDPQGKVSLLLAHAGEAAEVDDPWYTGDFAQAYDDIERGCAALLAELTRG